MDFPSGKELNINSKNFGAFISYMKQSSDPWYIKDQDSRFIYMNDCGLYYTGLPKGFNPEGKLDSECPAYWSEYADVIQANDKRVMDKQEVIPTLITLMYGGKEKLIQPFLTDVTPLITDGVSIGVVGRAKKLELYSMHHLAMNRRPDNLMFGNPTALFTNREFDVVFFALQSFSVKEIARRLNISPNTAKRHLQSVYEKAGVSALSQFIEFCRSKGYDNYAPNRFISSQPYLPLID